MKTYQIYLLALLSLILVSCFEEDIAVQPYDKGDAIIASVEMDFKYTMQSYYDLSTATVVSSNEHTLWDIGFDCRPNSYFIYLNTANIMSVTNLGQVDFATVLDTSGFDFFYDHPNGSDDSLAIGIWWNIDDGKISSKGDLYIIDRGKKENGRGRGFVKMQVIGFADGKYSVKFAELEETAGYVVEIDKLTGVNWNMLSFENGGEVINLEPLSIDWDLLFTKYTFLFDVVGFEVYSVTGALINMRHMIGAIDSVSEYQDIVLSDTSKYTFFGRRDIVGYNWKYLANTDGKYQIIQGITYILQDNEGYYYKLRFLDFYNDEGRKGYPKFEFIRL